MAERDVNKVKAGKYVNMSFVAGAGRSAGFSMSPEDQLLTKQVLEKHSHDSDQVDVRPLLCLVEDIFARANADISLDANVEGNAGGAAGFGVDGDIAASFDGSPDLPLMIERVSCEMGCKCLGGANAHDATTFSVLEILYRYSWEAKMVITLAALAAKYLEFLLLYQAYSTKNPLAQSMALLRQIPSVLQQEGDKMNSQMDAIKDLIADMLKVTKLVVDFSAQSESHMEPTVKYHDLPLAVYWTISSAVAAATQMTSRSLELSKISAKLKCIIDQMKLSAPQNIDDEQEEEDYNKIRNTVFKEVHQDKYMTVLKTLIYNKDDDEPLLDGSTKKRVRLDVLHGRPVILLLVTGFDISQDELTMLENIYESKTRSYSIVWVPIVDRSVMSNDSMQSQVKSKQNTMPWYSVYDPSIIGNAVIRFFNRDLNFKGKPILVTLDDRGVIQSKNAMHMMWIWKNKAFPFTSEKEKMLWEEQITLMQNLWLDLLVDNIDETIPNWRKDDKYTFIYGGEDLEWIKKFTKAARDAAEKAKISLEMVYVGKSCKSEVVRKNNDTIEKEKLSHHLKDLTSTWFFWTRLDSMLQSLVQLHKVNDNNKVIQEIKKIISYDKNAGGWAILAKGSELLVSVEGSIILDVLSKFDEWKKRVDELSIPNKKNKSARNLNGGPFASALQEKIKDAGSKHVSCRFEFPTDEAGTVPDQMKCPECRNNMKRYTTFACNHKEKVSL